MMFPELLKRLLDEFHGTVKNLAQIQMRHLRGVALLAHVAALEFDVTSSSLDKKPSPRKAIFLAVEGKAMRCNTLSSRPRVPREDKSRRAESCARPKKGI